MVQLGRIWFQILDPMCLFCGPSFVQQVFIEHQYGPGTVLGTWTISENKIDKDSGVSILAVS